MPAVHLLLQGCCPQSRAPAWLVRHLRPCDVLQTPSAARARHCRSRQPSRLHRVLHAEWKVGHPAALCTAWRTALVVTICARAQLEIHNKAMPYTMGPHVRSLLMQSFARPGCASLPATARQHARQGSPSLAAGLDSGWSPPPPFAASPVAAAPVVCSRPDTVAQLLLAFVPDGVCPQCCSWFRSELVAHRTRRSACRGGHAGRLACRRQGGVRPRCKKAQGVSRTSQEVQMCRAARGLL